MKNSLLGRIGQLLILAGTLTILLSPIIATQFQVKPPAPILKTIIAGLAYILAGLINQPALYDKLFEDEPPGITRYDGTPHGTTWAGLVITLLATGILL